MEKLTYEQAKELGYQREEEYYLYEDVCRGFYLPVSTLEEFVKQLEEEEKRLKSKDITIRLKTKKETKEIIRKNNLEDRMLLFSNMNYQERLSYRQQEAIKKLSRKR